MNPDLPAGDPENQWMWHESYRDLHKNMYRTSYSDMVHGREVCMKSDYPSGYGGHVPCQRFDILHKNTEFDRTVHLRRSDPSRDAHPSFKGQKDGIPTITMKPQGAKRNPTFKALPGDGTTNYCRAPFGQTRPVREVPTYRNIPATLQKASSSPALRSGAEAALAGSRHVSMQDQGSPNMGMGSPNMGMGSPNMGSQGQMLKNSVKDANEEARRQIMPTEAEILQEQMRSPKFSDARNEILEFQN